jgi:hypothetical protein
MTGIRTQPILKNLLLGGGQTRITARHPISGRRFNRRR